MNYHHLNFHHYFEYILPTVAVTARLPSGPSPRLGCPRGAPPASRYFPRAARPRRATAALESDRPRALPPGPARRSFARRPAQTRASTRAPRPEALELQWFPASRRAPFVGAPRAAACSLGASPQSRSTMGTARRLATRVTRRGAMTDGLPGCRAAGCRLQFQCKA